MFGLLKFFLGIRLRFPLLLVNHSPSRFVFFDLFRFRNLFFLLLSFFVLLVAFLSALFINGISLGFFLLLFRALAFLSLLGRRGLDFSRLLISIGLLSLLLALSLFDRLLLNLGLGDGFGFFFRLYDFLLYFVFLLFVLSLPVVFVLG